jgi:hypothetical protein
LNSIWCRYINAADFVADIGLDGPLTVAPAHRNTGAEVKTAGGDGKVQPEPVANESSVIAASARAIRSASCRDVNMG